MTFASLPARFLFAAALVGSGAAFGQSKIVDVPIKEGVVKMTETTVETVPQTIKVLSGKELQRVRAKGEPAKKFLAKYQPRGTQPTLAAYDLAFRAWQLDKAPRHTSSQVIDMLGAVLGNACVDQLGMEWIQLTDAQGTDLAVKGKTVEVTAFPFSTVQKRVQKGEHAFLAGVFEAIRHSLNESGLKARAKP